MGKTLTFVLLLMGAMTARAHAVITDVATRKPYELLPKICHHHLLSNEYTHKVYRTKFVTNEKSQHKNQCYLCICINCTRFFTVPQPYDPFCR